MRRQTSQAFQEDIFHPRNYRNIFPVQYLSLIHISSLPTRSMSPWLPAKAVPLFSSWLMWQTKRKTNGKLPASSTTQKLTSCFPVISPTMMWKKLLHSLRTVSYTHLDVYKRQLQAEVAWGYQLKFSHSYILRLFLPVSYTHLDVYKRQHPWR